MRPGQRVLVFAERCSFLGERGVVHAADPLTVLLDGERLPMAFAPGEVVADDSTPDLGAMTND